MEATLSKLVTLLSSIAHQLAERVRAVARIASRERPADPDVARLFELPFELMGVASLDGTILRVTPGFERVLGLAPEEIVGRRLFEIVHPDDREATAAVFAGGARVRRDLRVREPAARRGRLAPVAGVERARRRRRGARLGDRAAALGGRLRIDSPPGGGTVLAAELPKPD
jgi:PAS domain S-box-containing protein